MSFDTTAKVSLDLKQLLHLVDQLTEKDAEKVAARLEQRRKKAALGRLRTTFRKVRMNQREIDALVEEVRQERYDKKGRTRAAGR
ncbi:MAG: hypothetical protein QM724_06115 [Flavobacteriales bacterium]